MHRFHRVERDPRFPLSRDFRFDSPVPTSRIGGKSSLRKRLRQGVSSALLANSKIEKLPKFDLIVFDFSCRALRTETPLLGERSRDYLGVSVSSDMHVLLIPASSVLLFASPSSTPQLSRPIALHCCLEGILGAYNIQNIQRIFVAQSRPSGLTGV
jgi:hypothetical protein